MNCLCHSKHISPPPEVMGEEKTEIQYIHAYTKIHYIHLIYIILCVCV